MRKPKKPNFKYKTACADWKDTQSLLEELVKACKHFGVYIQDDPSYDGSDVNGFIISQKELSDKELRAAANYEFGEKIC